MDAASDLAQPPGMPPDDLAARVDALDRKLDIILEEISLQRRRRLEMEDLKDDLMRVGRDLYQTAVVELDDIHDSFHTVDLLHLGKKLLRNVDTITRSVEKLESLKDFIEDVSPLARQTFIDAMQTLDEYDRKGYFAFIREMARAADTVVTSYSAEDVRHLADNLVVILDTIKNLTQPDLLHAVNNALDVYQKLDTEVPVDASFTGIARDLASAETRRGIAMLLAMVRNLASQQGRQTSQEQSTQHLTIQDAP